jgi:hypothetical protein
MDHSPEVLRSLLVTLLSLSVKGMFVTIFFLLFFALSPCVSAIVVVITCMYLFH